VEFPFGRTVTRARRKTIPDPYNPSKTTRGSWADAESIDIEDAFVATSSSAPTGDATRTQVITAKSLYISDPETDVLFGDRITVGATVYYVDAIPDADVNPFTGWQPAKEIPLRNTEG
jgi:hypothetical protein